MNAVFETASMARQLAAAGYRVFPIRARMKGEPLIKAWQTNATTDAAQIAAWWPEGSQANIGLVGGDGRLILDIDWRKPGCREALAALEAQHGALPPTYTVTTPSGGEHRYFTGADVSNSAGKLGAGLDIKSKGGYVVAPPSYTDEIQGKQSAGYYQVKEYLPLAQAPAWLIELAGAPKAATEAQLFKLRGASPAQWADIRSALDHLATVPEVAGNKLWSDIGYTLLCLGDEGRELWCEWSARAPGYGGAIAPDQWWAAHCADRARSDYRTLFSIAQRYGWKNPASTHAPNAAPVSTTPPVPATMASAAVPVEEWPEPVDFFAGKLEAPPFDGSELPPRLAAYPLLQARQTGFDQSMGLNAALTIAAAAIPDYIQVCADSESNYFAQARLWSLTIAKPGAGKSPTQRDLLKPLWELHTELIKQWQAAEDARGDDNEGPPAPQPRVIVSDVTLEKLSDVLEENPRGVLLATDEFSAWLGSLDQYKSGSVPGRDRGEWLRLFDGGPHQIERVARGSKFIPNWGASILTASTPSQMQSFARNLPEDGLIQRFLIALARRQRPRDDRPNPGEVQVARAAYIQLIKQLWDMRPTSHKGIVYFTPEAKARFEAFSDENAKLTDAFGEVEPALAGHVAKYTTFALRIALTYHCVQVAASGNTDPAAYMLTLENLELALTFLRRSLQHARAMYLDRDGVSTPVNVARDIASFILANPTQTLLQRRELIQGITSFRKADETLQAAALRLIADMGWLRPVEDAGVYRKPHPTRFEVNPGVAPKFAKRAAEERERRALIVNRIAEHRKPREGGT